MAMARRCKFLALLGLWACGVVQAEVTKVEPSVSANLTVTDNARLNGNRDSDVMLSLRPRLTVEHRSGRASARFDYALDGVVHTDSGMGSRSVNTLNATGTLEALENFLFVDARAAVSGENLSVFAPLAIDNLTSSPNRGETRSFGVSPYIRGQFGRDASYSLRVDWSSLSTDSQRVQRSGNTRITGSVGSGIGETRFGWSVSADSSVNHYPEREDLRNELLRARLSYAPLPQATIFATVGREGYNYVEGESSRRVQGGGFSVGLGPRTQIAAERESRFFGHSASARISHRLPLAAGSIEYKRDLSSSNQEVFSAGEGNLLQTLFDLYASRIPDPMQRLTTVLDFMARTGMPLFLTRPFAFYTQQPFIDRRLQATLAWTGARNTIGVSGYRSRREAVATGFSLIDDFSFGRVIDNRGVALDWRHALTPLASLNLTLTQSHARAVDGVANTRNRSLLTGVQMPLSGKSTGFVSLRLNRGDGTSEYRENALLAGVRMTF